MKIRLFIALLCALPVVYCSDNDGVATTTTTATLTENASTARGDYPPYIQIMLCPMQNSPWNCFQEQSGRLLNLLDSSYKTKWSEFKDEANNEIVAKFQARGFSATDKVIEKTSTIFDKIETGVSEIKDFASSTANEILGREDDDEAEAQEDEDFDTDISFEEFAIDDEEEDEKKKGGIGNKLKKKKKKKPQHQGGGDLTAVLHDGDEDELDGIEAAAEILSGGGGHGIKLPHKYGRSLGVTRGKKKKKKKGLMKIILIASFLKAKIELLLKLLSAHLQIKFFAISVIGLLLNLIRFWLDVKRGHQAPSKVIYYENAHHQHHYDEHDDFDQGGYWRRSNVASTEYGVGADGLDDDSAYSRIGRNDYFPSSQGSSSMSSPSSSSYSKHGPIRMAYARQLPQGV